ncbi:TM2 domain-containing protein [Candidatus Uabimicrobium amorphum]|uniref:Membrane protein n=1 Tax=Uabimicrobium amorphum TaxID=2596890 RepID=A0A5S9IP60_UABAM|nr:TM2 domain-containing protein [Candidatus Uabimicrobium amorphum]BBM84892.1 membrane protein [Candidatus Uabimicrobium amorphum]
MDSNIDFEKKAYESVSIFKAYVAWLFGGWMGVHRFYLGKWFSGGLYMISFGLFIVGWAIDFLLIPAMVKSRRAQLAKKWQDEAEWARQVAEASGEDIAIFEDKFELAPWAGKSSWISYIEFPFRLLFFIFAPAIFTYFALIQGNWELIVLMAVILVATSFIHTVQKMLHFHPEVDKIPVLSEALSSFKKLYAYYMENKPRNFLFYVGYFFFGFLSMPFSQKTRTEFNLYRNMIFGIFILLILETALSYKSVYPPYLAIGDAATLLVAELLLLFFMVISFMMPMVTTSFSLSLSGKQNMLRVLTLVAVGFTILITVAIYQTGGFDTDSLGDSMNFSSRMQNKDFRRDMGATSEMFLSYYGRRAPLKQNAATKVSFHEAMTDMYRRNITGFVAGNETVLVKVFVIERPGKHDAYGLRYGDWILFLADHSGEVYKKWKDVPKDIQDVFEVVTITPLGDEKYRYITKQGLIDDLYQEK